MRSTPCTGGSKSDALKSFSVFDLTHFDTTGAVGHRWRQQLSL